MYELTNSNSPFAAVKTFNLKVVVVGRPQCPNKLPIIIIINLLGTIRLKPCHVMN